jgi:hypothetical protein
MATSDNKTADTDAKIFIGKGEETAWLTLALANRHGLVTGATGTGKTVSLQVMAEGFARSGVPVFAADIKGDLSGISEVGEAKDFIVKRASEMGLIPADQFSTVFWDVFGERSHQSGPRLEMGPLLLIPDARSERVRRASQCRFRVADRSGLTLMSMKDLRVLDASSGYQQEGSGCRRRPAGADPQGGAGLRQCHQGDSRNHSASASGAGKSGWHEILRRAGVDAEGFHED